MCFCERDSSVSYDNDTWQPSWVNGAYCIAFTQYIPYSLHRFCFVMFWWGLLGFFITILMYSSSLIIGVTVYPKKYAHGFCFAVLCCGYTLTDFPISIGLTSLALWQSNDCPSASKATLMNMDKYFMWIHYERLHNHNKAKHNKTVCIFLGIYCTSLLLEQSQDCPTEYEYNRPVPNSNHTRKHETCA